jgi:serine-type D-Ala-D-Ala endopeptidase (penicillin-binding protein 7)
MLCAAFAARAGSPLDQIAIGIEARSAAAEARTMVPVRKSKRVSSARQRYKARASTAHGVGFRDGSGALDLKSSAALVMDQETSQVLYSKNADAVLPIASLTKLMTAIVVAEAQLPLDELITISQDDVDTEKGSRSRLRVGTQLTRGEMLHLALGRSYPGGSEAFVAAMNVKAQALGMSESSFVESTGLSSRNQSSARDLATLVQAAHEHSIIREMSVSPRYQVEIGRRNMAFHNTNRLVSRPDWDIGLQKTGYIAAAGRCLVMQATMAGRPLILVFLDSAGKYSRLGDAERVRQWVTVSRPRTPAPMGELVPSE